MSTQRRSYSGHRSTFNIALTSLLVVKACSISSRAFPPTLQYEAGTIVAEGNFVIALGRFSGFGAPANWIAADILRIEDVLLVEHWDVIRDEATEEQSKSGAPMFGKAFPKYK